MSKTFEELKPIVRPEGVHLGVMKVDSDKCTNCRLANSASSENVHAKYLFLHFLFPLPSTFSVLNH